MDDSDDPDVGDADFSDDSDADTPPLTHQLTDAVERLHDSVNTDSTTPRRMIRTPSGKLISKSTAVIMLKEMFLIGSELSKDRLKRIEQCAASSQIVNQQLVEHDGTHLELFQDVAMAFDDGPNTSIRVEFGRIQKLVSCQNKRVSLRLSSVPLDNVPNGLEVRLRFYQRAPDPHPYYSDKHRQ